MPGLRVDEIKSEYVTINVNGPELAVHFHIYNDDPSKKTLLMTHGFAVGVALYIGIVPALAKHFRIVMFDNLAMGLNTRTDDVGDGLESPEKAERWLITWWEKFIEALGDKLPQKFYLTGHSNGGYMSMLYAMTHPERIEGLFLQSPACSEDETREGYQYDPYALRMQDLTGDTISRREADKMLTMFASDDHFLEPLRKMPLCLANMAMKS